MKLLPSLSLVIRVVLVGALAGPALMVSPAFGQAPAPGLDQQDFEHAQQAVDQGKLEEAAGLYEGIPVKYPVSPFIPAAAVRLGYVYFRLQQYDKAVKTLQGATTLKGIPPEMKELALSLVPQAMSAKAVAEGPKSPQRARLFEDAIKGFDAFIQAYPQSEEVESANYGKAVASYQIAKFDDAMKALRINLTRPNKSESVLDSQYLMALTMATVANNNAQELATNPTTAKVPEAKITEDFKNAELMLGDIVKQGTDVALANESRFQIGEMLYSQAGYAKDKEAQKALFMRALDVYRVVAGKDLVIAAQKARIERFKQARVGAFQQRDANLLKRFARAIEREQEKLATIESRPDATLVAKVKIAQVFYQLDRLDETRVVLGYLKPLVEDEEQKKTVAYYYALSLARQNADSKGAIKPLADRTEAVYKEFTTAYPADPIAENLPLMVAAGFTQSDPPKSLKYLDELRKNFPNSKLTGTADDVAISVDIALEKYDEALGLIAEGLAAKPAKEVAARLKFSKATVLQKQKNLQEALPIFKDVRDNYPGTEQAVQASFFYPQLLLEAGDFKHALPELQNFVKNHPKNDLIPTALYFLAQAQTGAGKADDALASYQRLADEFPEAKVAPFSYFQRAQILMQKEKPDAVIALMQQFMDKYPDEPTLFQAYDFVTQVQISKQPKKPDGTVDPAQKDAGKLEAIETYEKFATRKPKDPMAAQSLLRVGTLWKEAAVEGLGRWNVVRPEAKDEWLKRIDSSIKAAERVVRQYPEAPQVALALTLLLEDQKLLLTTKPTPEAKQAAEADVENYFQKLANEFKDKPSTRSKIIFTLAGVLMEKEKEKAMKLMAEVYNPALKYAPEDMDLYGTGLVDLKKFDEAEKLFKKLGEDYPIPAGKEPKDAPREIQEAQSIMLFGLGKILGEQGKTMEAKVLFDDLEKNYGWSPKVVAASLGIAEAQYEKKEYEEALKRLVVIVKNTSKSVPAELKARAMFKLAKIYEETGEFDAAINNYVKISALYASAPKWAAEGLFRGAKLLEGQAKGEIAIATPTPRAVPAKKPAPGAPAASGAPAPQTAAASAAAPATAAK